MTLGIGIYRGWATRQTIPNDPGQDERHHAQGR